MAHIKINESVKISDRIGQIGKNNFGSKMIITKYNNTDDINVYFPNSNYTAHNRAYKDFLEGKIKSWYDKVILGVGYFGIGKYKSSINYKVTNQYRCWYNMLQRCYDNKLHKTHPTYIGCTVCDEWHNFQNFAQWYDLNFYQIINEEMHLDKDILIKGNKVYSPETCVFVPVRINGLFKTNNVSNLPLGISTYYNKYQASCYNGNSTTRLGIFETVEEAFMVYKDFKENLIKQVANKYQNNIPINLYEAMYRYEVEIND